MNFDVFFVKKMATPGLLENMNGERLEPHHGTVIKRLWNDPGIKVRHCAIHKQS